MADKGKKSGTKDFQEDAQRSGPGQPDAASDAEAETGAKTAKKYPTMIIGISKSRKELHDTINALADKLHCRTSDLVWLGLEHVSMNPPKEAPKGVLVSSGSAAGFWVIPVTNKEGRATSIRVVEVTSRAQVNDGRTFFRFDRNDEKSRKRAEGQALKSAAYDAKLLNVKSPAASEKVAA